MSKSLLQILDDNHGEFKYGGAGQWTLSTLVQWYQKTSNYPAFASSTAFGTFSLEFTGTSIAFTGNTPTNAYSQVATVSIDGGTPYNITYSSTPPPAYVQWYQSPSLSDGPHTIVVDHLDGTAIDYALIEVGQNTPLSSTTLVIDNDDSAIQYSGKWQRNTDPFNAGSLPDGFPLHNTTHRSCNPGDTFALGFAGTSFSVYGILNWDNLGTLSVTYTLDGSTVSQTYPVTTSSPEHVSQDNEAINFLYFSQDNLSSEVHTLVVTITECQNSQYILDYVTYTPSFSTLANMPNIAPVSPSPFSPSSGPSPPSSPSQNSPPVSGSNNVSPTSMASSNPSQGSGLPRGSADSGSPAGPSSSGSSNDSPNTGGNTGAQTGLQNGVGGSVRATSNKTPVGAIVGGTVGGILFLILLVVLWFLIWKRRSLSKAGSASQGPSLTSGDLPSSQMRQLPQDQRGFAQFRETVFPFQDPVGSNPLALNSGTIADLKRQRADSSNVRSAGSAEMSAVHRNTSPETVNLTSSTSLDLKYVENQAEPPAYEDPSHRQNTSLSQAR